MKNVLILVLVILSLAGFSQKKKEIKKNRIKSIVVTDTENGKTINDSKTIYNTNGEVIEEVNYDKTGQVKSILKYKYNSEGDVLEEAEYDPKNQLKENVQQNIIVWRKRWKKP